MASPREKVRPASASIRSRAKKFAQQQPHLGQTAKKLAQRAQKHQNLAIFPEQGELFRVSRTNSPRRANFFAFPTPHHRAGRFISRNYTTQYPSPGHHHPTTTPTGRKLSRQHPPQGATGTKLSQQHPPRGSTGTKLSRHAQKQRILAISREQGESFPVPNATPPSRENFLPQLHHSIPITGTPPPNTTPTGRKLSQHAHNQRNPAISREQGELFPVPNTAPPSRENFLPQLHHSIPITGTPPPNTTPTGRKLSLQHPPQGATGTKLSQQHPPHGSTGTKLSQRAQKHQNLAISREQGESFPVPNATPPSRENFLPQQHHPTPITGTRPPQPAQNPPSNAADNTLSPGHESTRGTKLSQHSHLKAQPVQNSPGTSKNNENWPFLASRENSFPFPTPHHRAGRIFSRNNTILGSLSTQLTGWSPLSPDTRPIHPSAGHCADY